jgi:Domain of unknown function (DUF4337)
MEPADAKDLIDEAIERAEERQEADLRAEHDKERQFRDRLSLMVGAFAVALAIVHVAAGGAQRQSLLKGIEASDTFAYMQAKIVRETVLKTAAAETGAAPADREAWRREAVRLRRPDAAGHGIGQLQSDGERQRDEGERAAKRGEGYELGETALQMAIVLLSIAMVARSRWIAIGAVVVAGLGLVTAIVTKAGLQLF